MNASALGRRGSTLVGGCWNSPGYPLIYGSLSYACAMREVLAYADVLCDADVPAHVSVERY